MVSIPLSLEIAVSSTIKKTTRSRNRDVSQWQDTWLARVYPALGQIPSTGACGDCGRKREGNPGLLSRICPVRTKPLFPLTLESEQISYSNTSSWMHPSYQEAKRMLTSLGVWPWSMGTHTTHLSIMKCVLLHVFIVSLFLLNKIPLDFLPSALLPHVPLPWEHGSHGHTLLQSFFCCLAFLRTDLKLLLLWFPQN